MKKKKKTQLIIIVSVMLILMIALIFIVINKETIVKNKNDYGKGKLVCEINTPDLYNIKYTINYKNGKVEKIVIVYKYSRKEIDYNSYSDTLTQMDYYMRLKDSKYKYKNNDLYITLNSKVYDNNKSNDNVKNIYAGWTKTKEYLEELGYSCSK